MTKMLLTKDIILEQESRLYQAIKTGDVELLETLLHDDLLFVVPGGMVITKAVDLDTYRSGALKVDELLPEIQNLNIIDDVAVVTVVIKLKGSFSGTPFEATYRYIRFWKKFDTGIQVIGGSGVAI